MADWNIGLQNTITYGVLDCKLLQSKNRDYIYLNMFNNIIPKLPDNLCGKI